MVHHNRRGRDSNHTMQWMQRVNSNGKPISIGESFLFTDASGAIARLEARQPCEMRAIFQKLIALNS